MPQITGKAFIYVDGDLLQSRDGAKIGLGNPTREAVIGDTGTHGYMEKNQTAYIECEVSHASDTSMQSLIGITDATITFETDSGQSFVLRNAWLSNTLELEATDGKLSLRFEGVTAEEQ